MTVKELKDLIVECLIESDVPVGGKVGEIPIDVLKTRMVPSQPSRAIKLRGFKTEEPDPELQKELDTLAHRYDSYLVINLIAYTDNIKLQGLNASKDAPKGTGSSFMRDLTDLADDKGLMITLTPAVKGYGDKGFKKTSSYQRLVDFYKRFGFKSKYGKTSYRPDLSDTMFRDPKSSSKPLNEFNIKVGKYTYDGFTSTQEDNIKRKIHLYHLTDNLARKEAIKKEFETLYQYLVGRNRVLNLINIDQSDYLGINTPEMDVVYGAVSGIPPESIKDYVEVTKGGGGKSIPSRYKRDSTASNYIQLQTV